MKKWDDEFFQNDICKTIRKEYKTLLSLQYDDDFAEEKIINYFLSKCTDASQEGLVWLSMALIEWKHGRLSSYVRDTALACSKMSNPAISEYAIKQLIETITSPIPLEKQLIRPARVRRCPYLEGSLLAYRITTSQAVSDSIYFHKYALIRVIKVMRQPVSLLVPDGPCNESMLIGLYNWIGDTIPDKQLAETLEYTPINVLDSSISKESFMRAIRCHFPNGDLYEQSANISMLMEQLTKPTVETCCNLDWTRPANSPKVLTFLGCDATYQKNCPDFFKTEITNYSFCNFSAFDAVLVNRLKQLNG